MQDHLLAHLSREYQAIIAYVVYSQVLKGAEYMNIADQLVKHAHQELEHALTISRQIDYLGKMPTVTPKPVKTSDQAREILRFDLDNENETIPITRKEFANARLSVSSPWQSKFERSSCKSRTIKSTLLPLSGRKFQT